MKVSFNTFNTGAGINFNRGLNSRQIKPSNLSCANNLQFQNANASQPVKAPYFALPSYGAISFTSSNRISRKEVPFANSNAPLRCPCCGVYMEKQNERYTKELARAIASSKGKELSKMLEDNMDEFQVFKRELIQELIEAAPKHPEENISELLNTISDKYMNTLRLKQIKVATELTEEIPRLNNKQKEAVNNWLIWQIERIMNAEEEGDFKNKYLVASFIKLAYKNNIKIDEEKIKEYFEKLPHSKRNTEAFVAKYKRRKPKETVYKLMKNSEPTIEHIVPFYESRSNKTGNLLVMCSDCNSARGHLSYDEFTMEHPEMGENIFSYFEDVNEMLQGNCTSKDVQEDYQNYIADVTTTLEGYSPEFFNEFFWKNSRRIRGK